MSSDSNAIGPSLLENAQSAIDPDSGAAERSELTATANDTTAAVHDDKRSMISTALSITIPDAKSWKERSGCSERILIDGPGHSGRSSMCMDIALEVAASAPCLCNSSGFCHCLPIAYLRPDSKSDSFFPLRCQRREDPRQKPSPTIQQRIQQIKDKANPKKRNKASSGPSWDLKSLRRIQVHHLVSFQECLEFLLSVPGKAVHEQPYGAIIIDDIDCLADDSLGGSEAPMQISQFLAILFNTLNFIKPYRPLVCVSINSNSKFPLDCYMGSFFPMVLTIHDLSSSNNHHHNFHSKARSLARTIEEETNDKVLSSWKVVVKRTNNNNNKSNATNGVPGHVEYAICQIDSDCHRILWEKMR